MTDDCRGLPEAATLLLFCSSRPVPEPVVDPVSPTDELPEQVSSEDELIDGKDLVECESDILKSKLLTWKKKQGSGFMHCSSVSRVSFKCPSLLQLYREFESPHGTR